MFFEYLKIFLTFFAVAMGAAIYFFFILKKPMIGKFWGAIIVGLIGAFVGGVVNLFLKDIFLFLSNLNQVNIFSALFTSLLFLWILSKVSSHK